MEDLREQAHGVGGEVITLLGNHEWMNAIGEWVTAYALQTLTHTFQVTGGNCPASSAAQTA